MRSRSPRARWAHPHRGYVEPAWRPWNPWRTKRWEETMRRPRITWKMMRPHPPRAHRGRGSPYHVLRSPGAPRSGSPATSESSGFFMDEEFFLTYETNHGERIWFFYLPWFSNYHVLSVLPMSLLSMSRLLWGKNAALVVSPLVPGLARRHIVICRLSVRTWTLMRSWLR
jgi:hypothetical protein